MATEESVKKYRDARIVHLINKFITLKDDDMKKNNEILNEVVSDIVKTMKQKDEFFKDYFRNILFVGSYYKGTKVGKAEEFDLNMVIKLPVRYNKIQFESKFHGFTKILVDPNIYITALPKHHKLLSSWINSEWCLNHQRFRSWMEGLFIVSVNHLVSLQNYKYKICVKKSGPAFTLCVNGPDSTNLCVDMVPVLEFTELPPLSKNDIHHESWHAVPKPPDNCEDPHLHWRMSFYNTEKEILKKFGYVKPVIRQIKKLRDKENWKLIASYHIETLFLHELPVIEKKYAFNKDSEIELFIHMLNELKVACDANEILNYWDTKHNIIKHIQPYQLKSISGRLNKIIRQINEDPLLIAYFVLSKEELSQAEADILRLRNNKCLTQMSETKDKSSELEITDATGEPSSFSFMDAIATVAPIALEAFVTHELTSNTPLTTLSTLLPTRNNENVSNNNPGNNVDLSQIMSMLQSIRSEVVETRNAVQRLGERVSNVERIVTQLQFVPSSRREARGEQVLQDMFTAANYLFHIDH